MLDLRESDCDGSKLQPERNLFLLTQKKFGSILIQNRMLLLHAFKDKIQIRENFFGENYFTSPASIIL